MKGTGLGLGYGTIAGMRIDDVERIVEDVLS
jgi:hypothetical protein